MLLCLFFFFSSRRRHTRYWRDWSSDVCSSDLLTPGKARALLGQFLFSGEEVDKPVTALSGGERQRLSLAILVHSGSNVLVLDEPTNHLDLESREALRSAERRVGTECRSRWSPY